MLYGFYQCLDTFLYIWTFLPIRITIALVQALATMCHLRKPKQYKEKTTIRRDKNCIYLLLHCFSNRILEPAQVIDIIKGLVVVGCAIPMCFMDISVVYHTVRAQAAIKLYMFFNMLEVSKMLD